MFTRTSREQGPFHEAGYKDYWCEGRSNENLTPDIFGFSDERFCICDLSMSKQKGQEIGKYNNCTPTEYIWKNIIGLSYEPRRSGLPFLITDEIGLVKDRGYNLIQVETPVNVAIEDLDDERLEEILLKWQGFETVEPSFQLLAVPESPIEELKRPLAGILKWAAAQGNDWIPVISMVEKLLGYQFGSFSEKSRGGLKRNISKILSDLSRSYLSGYLSYDREGKRFRIDLDIDNYQSRSAFSNKINEWLDIKPIEFFFDDEDIDEDED